MLLPSIVAVNPDHGVPMTTIVLFHSALGRNRAVHDLADVLRSDGHEVHTPDLYDGAVFDDLDEGVAERDRIGIDQLLARATDAIVPLPDEVVYAGMSMGTMPAQLFAATRPGARGALLIQGAARPEDLGLGGWPADVPLQIHVGADDRWFDADHAAEVAASLPAGSVDVAVYDTSAHVFCDPDASHHDPHATRLLHAHIGDWLRGR
jgi:dienelactone hydrolase